MNPDYLSIELGQSSLTGIREFNEDFYACVTPTSNGSMQLKGIAAVVADGTGNNGDGREASQYAGGGFFSEYFSTPDSWDIQKSVDQVIRSLNKWMFVSGQQRLHTKGLVTTFSLAVFCQKTLHVFHVGDSRIYRFQDNHLQQLTRDHNDIKHKQRLLRGLGMDSEILLDYHKFPLEVGDVFVMMTDGIYSCVKDEDMVSILTQSTDLEKAANLLTQLAFKRESKDNMTCQLIKIKSLPAADVTWIKEVNGQLGFPERLREGDVMDNFVIKNELGSGRMGTVYLAENKDNRTWVALKCPNSEFQEDPEFRERLAREEWVGQKLNSPYLMKTFSPTRARSRYYYLITEYCAGESLRQRLERGELFSVSETVEIGKQICRGLGVMHRADILHRDIKPDSIMLSPGGQIKLIDYGIVKVGSFKALTVYNEHRKFLGSVQYAAPEIFKNARGTVHSEIYSLGVNLYEMLSGRYPYGEVLENGVGAFDKYMSLSNIRPEIPLWVDRIIQCCVASDPALRYRDVPEVLYQLEHPESVDLKVDFKPFIEKNPLLFWKLVSSVLLGIVLILAFLLVKALE